MEITMEQEIAMNPVFVFRSNPYDLEAIKSEYLSYKKSVLKPTYRQKSFYSKAHVFSKDSTYVLRSYQTPVMVKINGYYYRLWNGWSATTAIHVNSFIDTYGGFHLNKAMWKSIPVGQAFMFSANGKDLVWGNPHEAFPADSDELPFY